MVAAGFTAVGCPRAGFTGAELVVAVGCLQAVFVVAAVQG
jgi:hypothetical protein